MSWTPPTDSLHLRDGLWQSHDISEVSYPEEGNHVCFQVEDSSYWFAHRNRCILAVLRSFPPAGALYDIGGGNGFVACEIQDAGMEVVLVEPGGGAKNALNRGVKNVIHATLDGSGLRPESMYAAGAFDVIEHIENDAAFLTSIRTLLRPGGRFYCTVPAIPALWSREDVIAGHYKRYNRNSLIRALKLAGFEIEFISSLFTWLILPIFVFRALPWRWSGDGKQHRDPVKAARADHTVPRGFGGFVEKIHNWELSRLTAAHSLPFGASLTCCARKAEV